MDKKAEKNEPLTQDTIIGSRKITKAELLKFFKATLGEDYKNHATVMEDALKKIFVYGTPFNGINLGEIIAQRFNPSWYENIAESVASFRIQRATKAKIEDVITPYFQGDRQKNALDFAAYWHTNKMPLKWDAWNTWKAHSKSKILCWVYLNPFVRPAVWVVSPCLTNINAYEDTVLNEGLENFVWDNFKHCSSDCHGACRGTKSVTILGKAFNNICNEVFEVNNKKIDFVSPDETAISRIKRLLELEKTARG